MLLRISRDERRIDPAPIEYFNLQVSSVAMISVTEIVQQHARRKKPMRIRRRGQRSHLECVESNDNSRMTSTLEYLK
ncbi:hypothetical protein NKI95_14960 [Mesorhizobium sp. M0306]|uniref:hypothetical protein n=1 Tax=Mesorhizobium sp. M0306 TaxID=2956932 RepID=UPI00333B1CC3